VLNIIGERFPSPAKHVKKKSISYHSTTISSILELGEASILK